MLSIACRQIYIYIYNQSIKIRVESTPDFRVMFIYLWNKEEVEQDQNEKDGFQMSL